MRRLFLLKVLAIVLAAGLSAPLGPSSAQAQTVARGASGLPLPRFVSLKATRVNLRVGPGLDYAVAWLYTRSGVPMEIVQEYDNWRRVRDAHGTEGWVYQSLLSGERTAVAAPWDNSAPDKTFIDLHREARLNSNIVARLEPGVIVNVHACNGEWCRAEVDGAEGWVAQNEVWGVYPNEVFQE